MTHATKALYPMLLRDYVKVGNLSDDSLLFDERDIENSMDRIDVVGFHEACVVVESGQSFDWDGSGGTGRTRGWTQKVAEEVEGCELLF